MDGAYRECSLLVDELVRHRRRSGKWLAPLQALRSRCVALIWSGQMRERREASGKKEFL